MVVSQYDNSVAEEAGLLKMDFLGLRTLTIIKDTLAFIKETHDLEIDIDQIDLEDKLTYQLFHRGDTIGIFQYESPGMQKYLKDLKPNKFEDLIAMNALYRLGPIQYIPNFIERKAWKKRLLMTFLKWRIPERNLWHHGLSGAGNAAITEACKFYKGRSRFVKKGDGKKNRKLIDETYPKFYKVVKPTDIRSLSLKKYGKTGGVCFLCI